APTARPHRGLFVSGIAPGLPGGNGLGTVHLFSVLNITVMQASDASNGWHLLKMLSKLASAVLAVWLGVPVAYAATINAASPALADVSTAVNRAVNGDTVVLPSGISIWCSTLSITTFITLLWAITNNTKLLHTGDLITFHPSA